MSGAQQGQAREQHRSIERYYRCHAKIYDLTRWSFLRGRETLMERLAARLHPRRILEVGCGTGKNLLHLGRRFPKAQLWGLDLSPHMLAQAQEKLRGLGHRLTLLEASYDQPVAPDQFDLGSSPMPSPCLTRAGRRPWRPPAAISPQEAP